MYITGTFGMFLSNKTPHSDQLLYILHLLDSEASAHKISVSITTHCSTISKIRSKHHFNLAKPTSGCSKLLTLADTHCVVC
jgi:hypothetical protein